MNEKANNNRNLYNFLTSVFQNKSSNYPSKEYNELKELIRKNAVPLSAVILVNIPHVSIKINSEFTIIHERNATDDEFNKMLANMKNWFRKFALMSQ